MHPIPFSNIFNSFCFLFFVIAYCIGIVPLCPANDFTLEQLINGVKLSREEIRSGELHVIISGSEAPLMTMEEGQRWLEEQKQELRNNIDQKGRIGDTEFNTALKRDAFYKFRLEQLSQMLQRQLDSIEFYREQNIAFEIYGPNTQFGNRTSNFRYRSVINNRLIDRSEPYFLPDYYVSVFDGETLLKEYEYKSGQLTEVVDRYFGDVSTEFYVYDQLGRSVGSIPIDSAKLLGKEVIDSVTCYIVKFQPEEHPTVVVKYWIAPDKGFCVYKEEYGAAEKGSVAMASPQLVCYNADFRQFPGGIWYPTQRRVVSYHKRGSRKGQISSDKSFFIKNAVFNGNFPNDFFYIDSEVSRSNTISGSVSVLGSQSQELLECGPRSLLIVCNQIGIDTTFEELARLSEFSPDTGTTMAGLYKAAKHKGMNPVGVNIQLDNLKHIELPVIAHVNQDRFLVITRVTNSHIHLQDPLKKYSALPPREFDKIWMGNILMFMVDRPEEAFTETTSMVYSSNSNVRSAPAVQIETPIHDFGEVFGGENVEHIFTFFNVGEDPLEITEVQSSCQCTAGLLSATTILPGERGEIKVTLKIPTRNEEIREVVKLYTNLPNQSIIELTVKANAKTPLQAIPSSVLLGKVSLDRFTGRYVILRQMLREKVQIVEARTNSEHIVATLEPPAENGNGKVLITVNLGIPTGPFAYQLRIDYSHNAIRRSLKVPILGEVLSDLDVFPKRLFLGVVVPQESSKKSVKISRIRGENVRILSVKSASKYVSTRIDTIEPGVQYEVKVSIAAAAPAGNLTDTLTVVTDSKNQPEIKIPLYCIIQAKK